MCPVGYVQPKFRFQFYEGIINKISYEHHDYKSVEKNPILGYVTKSD